MNMREKPTDYKALYEKLLLDHQLLKEEFEVNVAGGQDHLKGKIFRINQMGLIPPYLRLPMTEFSKQHHDQMREALAVAGVTLEDAA